MFAAKEDTLSADELRNRLYHTFKEKGVLNTLKTQLRNQLIQELKPPSPSVPDKCDTLLLSACNSIVADHLRRSGYEYTLSVFSPESCLFKEKVLKTEDLLRVLNIGPQSELYKSLTLTKDNSDKGFLINLLTQLTHHHTHGHCHDADTQTASPASYGESLVEKMKMIDKEYENVSRGENKWFSFESKLASYRKELEMQLQAEMKAKMEHFKDVEITKVKMEEKAQYQREFDKLKRDLERTYDMKAQTVSIREKNAIDRLQKQQEIEEKNIYMQRQSVLKEIETLHARENEFRLEREAFEKTCEIQEDKLKNAEEMLRRRELAVKTMESTYDQRLKDDLSRYQLELKEEYIKRTEKLSENESRNKVETARIQKESAAINATLDEHSRVCSEKSRLQVELDLAQQQNSLLSQQQELLRERLESISDYPSLKREITQLHSQAELLKKQLEEAQEENRLLHADMGKPSKEQLALQMELQRLQGSHRLDKEEFDNQKQVLQAQLQSEVERCGQLHQQLMEYEDKLKWMTDHVEDLKMQLRQTHQALENEVLRNPKPSIVDRSVLEFSADNLVSPEIYVDRTALRTRKGCGDVGVEDGPSQENKLPWSGSQESNTELVAEARARILELKREAETMEEAYRRYQQMAVPAVISLKLPPRPLSFARPSHRPESPPRKQDSHYSPHQSKMFYRSSFSPTTKTLSQAPYDSRDPHQASKPRLAFSKDQNQSKSSGLFSDHSLHSLTEPLFLRDNQAQGEQSPEFRRLSSSPYSTATKKLQKESVEDLSADRGLFPAPHDKVSTSGDSSSELSPPRSPQLKSTARNSPSLGSSPQPEEIKIEDLTGTSSEPGHIPELLLDTAVPLPKEAPDGPSISHPQDLPEALLDSHGQVEDPQILGELSSESESKYEEQTWERERKEKQELRQREQEEARERELKELERLEKERDMLVEQTEQARHAEELETGTEDGGQEGADNYTEESKVPVENPLEKYMKIVLEAREKQHAQGPGREEDRHESPESNSLSEEKDNSIAVFSHKDDDDEEDFW